MLKKLRIKFVCFTMAIVTVMLCVIFGTVYYFIGQSLESASLQTMRELAETPLQPDRLNQWAEELHLPYLIAQMGLRGDLIAVGGYFDLSDDGYLRQIVSDAASTGEQSGVLKEYGLRYYRASTGFTQRIVFTDISAERETMRNLLQACALIGAGSFLAFLLLSLLLSRLAIRPVERAWEQQRQFVADASHELKTPLTVILTNAELLQAEGYDQDSRARFSGSILAMAHQMRGLVESLLELARVDNGAIRTATGELDLSALVQDALLPFEPLYFEQGLALETEIEEGLRVKGSETYLRQVPEILLDNAMKYAQPQSAVSLQLRRQGQRCQLSVASRGEEISKEDLKNIFKRFYRADKARSLDHSYGLGLAIAESIVTEHGGKIWAESAGGVNTFTVELPTA